MTFHIFNPEHDMALAFGQPFFTPPHVVRAMRVNLGFLPGLWAKRGDVVIVDDVNYALKAAHKAGKLEEKVLFMTLNEATQMLHSGDSLQADIQPWGWDMVICQQLRRVGIPDDMLPDAQHLLQIRSWSNRTTGAMLLRNVRKQIPETIGESFVCSSIDEVTDLCEKYHDIVIKAPWSCSGRGIRYVQGLLDEHLEKWVNNILMQQNAVTVEPFYNKVIDLGMEFTALQDGTVRYDGLSVFHTENGAYMGNIIATEQHKRERIVKFVSVDMLEIVKTTLQKELEMLFKGRYVGPLGIDMMVVAYKERFALHPLVEMNLRRTMGHVALAFNASPLEPERLMRVRANTNFELQVKPIENAFVKVL